MKLLLTIGLSFLIGACAFNQVTPSQKAQINNIMIVSVMGDTFSYTRLKSDPADSPEQEPNTSVETRQVQEWGTDVWIANYIKKQLDEKQYQTSVHQLSFYQGMSEFQLEGVAIQAARAQGFSHVLLIDKTGRSFFPEECKYTPQGYGVISYEYLFLMDHAVVCATPVIKFIDATTARTIAARSGINLFQIQKNTLNGFEPPIELAEVNSKEWQILANVVNAYLIQRVDNALAELNL